MYLKAIEIQGFKSFANKINLDFHDGITAIVGPNGSGKSNIADAMRWVLGEQSAKTLRGSNMRDVIFAGSSERKAYSYAYVSIIMDNSDRALKLDFDEVVVSRRVYRSGESEYLLNDSVCRLKDVQELFYDTGIGKEGYSIIGQGQIDRILSERPEERRELFDEAAGIVKFKRNKQEALKKLESEQQSLERVNDIINELDARFPSLEKEAEKAKAYLKLRDRLREEEIVFFNLSYSKYLNEGKELEEKIKLVTENLQLCDARLYSVKEEYGKNQDKVSELEEELSELSSSANDKEIEGQQYEAHIELLKEQINTLNEKNRDCVLRIEEQSELGSQKNEELRVIEKKQTELADSKLELEEKVRILEKEFEALKEAIMEINTSNNEQSGEIFKLSGNINSTQSVLVKNQEQLLELKTSLDILVQKKEEYEKELEFSVTADEENKKNLRDANGEIERYKLELVEKKKEINELRGKQENIQAEISATLRDLDLAKSKQTMLQNMLNSYEGYSYAIKKIMELKKEKAEIIGVVADIINMDSKYELALEIALGSKIQNIIVEDDTAAKKFIHILKQNKYGRATFLPLNHMKGKDYIKNTNLLSETGVLGYAYDLVKVEEKYSDLIKNLLGGIIVVDEIEHAIRLSHKYKQSVRMVTLQGELFSVGGSITGGDYKKSYNLLGRKNEIQALEDGIKKTNQKLESLDIKHDTVLMEMKNKKEEIDIIECKNDEIQDRLNELKINEQKLENLINTAKKRLDEIDSEIKSKDLKLINITAEISDNELSIVRATEHVERLNLERAESQTKEDEMKQRSLELAHALEKERITLATMNQEIGFNEEAVLRLGSETEGIKAVVCRLSEQASGALTEVERKQKEIDCIKKEIETAKSSHTSLLKKISEKSNLKNRIMEHSKELFKSLDELKSEYQLLGDENTRLLHLKDKSESDIQVGLDYMWNEYELSISALQEYGIGSRRDIRKLETLIKDLKKEIKEFGTVNIGSIEECQEVGSRLAFLNEQKTDIESSEAALLQLIRELDEGMCGQFKERFKLIAEYFDKVFKKLFGGGSAALEMMDKDNVLETGIMIHVQPPGKKLQNMLVLSGGEKALTAIALLFAIQSLKPSPFCLLDEIEAALDDSNVDRFADYLMNLTEKTQFIIITHRKGTMTAADRLYGITMQEKGVSSLVSVNLVEKELN